MKIVQKNIKELVPAEYNPRQLTTDQYAQIKDSLETFGFVDPIIVNVNPKRKNVIIGGHQRVTVWGDMGNRRVPAVEVDLPMKKEKELNIRLNKNVGGWNWDVLANEFDMGDLTDWGFHENELTGANFGGLRDGQSVETLHQQSIQLKPQREYFVVMCDETGEEFDKLVELLDIRRARRGGYKEGSAFDVLGVDRVIQAETLIEKLTK